MTDDLFEALYEADELIKKHMHTKAGNTIDAAQRKTWKEFAELGIVEEVKESQLGFKPTRSESAIYRLPSGDEVWMEVTTGESKIVAGERVSSTRRVDMVKVTINKDKTGKIKSVQLRGMDNHPYGPDNPNASSNARKHFRSKKITMVSYSKIIRDNNPEIEVKKPIFNKEDSFFHREAIDEIKGIEKDIKKHERTIKRLKESPNLSNADRNKIKNLENKIKKSYKNMGNKKLRISKRLAPEIFSPEVKALGRSLGTGLQAVGIASAGVEIIQAEYKLYKNKLIWGLAQAIKDGDESKRAKIKEKLKSLQTGSVRRILEPFYKNQISALIVEDQTLWKNFIDWLDNTWEEQAEEAREKIKQKYQNGEEEEEDDQASINEQTDEQIDEFLADLREYGDKLGELYNYHNTYSGEKAEWVKKFNLEAGVTKNVYCSANECWMFINRIAQYFDNSIYYYLNNDIKYSTDGIKYTSEVLSHITKKHNEWKKHIEKIIPMIDKEYLPVQAKSCKAWEDRSKISDEYWEKRKELNFEELGSKEHLAQARIIDEKYKPKIKRAEEIYGKAEEIVKKIHDKILDYVYSFTFIVPLDIV